MIHDCFKCKHGYMVAPLSEWWCEILEKSRASHDGQVWSDNMGDACWKVEKHSRECDDFVSKEKE
jgi:hypothetical protein